MPLCCISIKEESMFCLTKQAIVWLPMFHRERLGRTKLSGPNIVRRALPPSSGIPPALSVFAFDKWARKTKRINHCSVRGSDSELFLFHPDTLSTFRSDPPLARFFFPASTRSGRVLSLARSKQRFDRRDEQTNNVPFATALLDALFFSGKFALSLPPATCRRPSTA